MIDPTVCTFVPQTLPPADRAGAAYWFAFQDQKMIVRTAGNTVEAPLLTDLAALGLVPLRWQYLGYLENGQTQPIHCYSAEIDPAVALADGLVAEGLRDLYAPLGDVLFNVAGRAVQIVTWDRTHQYCGQCATPTEALSQERARRCPACGLTSYPRISPAAIIAIVRRDEHGERILLARNHRFPPGRYSVLAGFVEPGESLEACAQREVFEEVGIRIKNVRYFGSQPWPFPNSLMLGFTAEYESGEIRLEESELADAQWFSVDNFPSLPPKMTIARKLIDWFVEKQVRFKPRRPELCRRAAGVSTSSDARGSHRTLSLSMELNARSELAHDGLLARSQQDAGSYRSRNRLPNHGQLYSSPTLGTCSPRQMTSAESPSPRWTVMSTSAGLAHVRRCWQ